MSTTNERAFADLAADLVNNHDLPDTLARLVEACATAYPAAAVAIMATNSGGNLELLCATSHRAEELDVLQIQTRHGPCVSAIENDAPVISADSAELLAQWGDVGAAFVDAGFQAVHAFPLHWRGQAIGGLNILLTSRTDPDLTIGQFFADLATLAVLRARDLSADELVGRVHEAVASRAVIERAKGVLAVLENLSMEDAHDDLLARARASGIGLTQVAKELVADQHQVG